jgi:hypothetical protein
MITHSKTVTQDGIRFEFALSRVVIDRYELAYNLVTLINHGCRSVLLHPVMPIEWGYLSEKLQLDTDTAKAFAAVLRRETRTHLQLVR